MSGNGNIFEFEFGKDVRDESRLKQDEEWSQAIADGRGHVSHRELTMLNAPQFVMSIQNYNIIEELVEALYGTHSLLKKITPEILQIIIEYGMPGHGPIVNTCIIKRNVTPLLFANSLESSCSIANKSFPFRICVRKRPMADFEKSFGSYDVCNTRTKNHVTLHEGKLARNGRQLSMTHYEYVFDEVYGETATNEEVCRRSVEPLLSWAIRGNQSSLLCFGQTGTGKTYTLYGALDYLSARLAGKTIRITFYEVHGKKCYDLLSNRNIVHLRSDENDVMHVRGARQIVLGGRQSSGDSSELMAVLRDALALRSSEMTERNPISSRSHAVCTIEIAADDSNSSSGSNDKDVKSFPPKAMSLASYLRQNQPDTPTDSQSAATTSNTDSPQSSMDAPTIPAADAHSDSVFAGCGRITLVDLAGSERNYETVQMTAQQHKESADINFALMALKDCFRAYHQQLVSNSNAVSEVSDHEQGLEQPSSAPPTAVRIPYRSSLLTKVLKECFTCDSVHRTTIIATVSPTPVDLLHTVNTLSHVILMSPTLSKLTDRLTVEVPMVAGSALSTTPVSEWTAEQVNAWLGIAENGRFSHVVLPPKMDGSKLLHLTATNLAELFTTQENTSRREKEGRAWVVSAEETDKQYDIANALWSAVRREQQSALVKVKLAKSLKEKGPA